MANCTDCSQESAGIIDLHCHKHFICQGCLTTRGKNRPKDIVFCVLCKTKEVHPSYTFKDAVLSQPTNEEEKKEPVSSDTSEFFDGKMPGIWIFVDDSNIWIEAKANLNTSKQVKITGSE